MARLVTWTDGVGIVSLAIASGPAIRNSGVNTAQDGSEQVVAGIGDRVAFDIALSAKQGLGARRERGQFAALLSGVNAIRFKLVDADRMTPAEAGVVGPYAGQPWANGEPWENGMNWGPSYPSVAVAASAAADAGIVKLADEFWGAQLNVGDWIGFWPFHLGAYMVIEALEDRGEYRIWPRLRKALTIEPATYCTLTPTLAMRPTSPDAFKSGRDLVQQKSSITLVEVIDPHARQYFAD